VGSVVVFLDYWSRGELFAFPRCIYLRYPFHWYATRRDGMENAAHGGFSVVDRNSGARPKLIG
jgi:hypothetical protein